jgi:hypothetical protein
MKGPLVTLSDKVRGWLESQGFPLEMRAAAAFRQVGFEVRQSSYYIDPETSKGREIDVLASDPDILGVVQIHLVIECKSHKKPWVLLASDDTLAGYNRKFSFGVLTERAIAAFAQRIREFLDSVPWFRKEGRTGYSFR